MIGVRAMFNNLNNPIVNSGCNMLATLTHSSFLNCNVVHLQNLDVLAEVLNSC